MSTKLQDKFGHIRSGVFEYVLFLNDITIFCIHRFRKFLSNKIICMEGKAQNTKSF